MSQTHFFYNNIRKETGRKVPVRSTSSLFRYWPPSASLKVWPLIRPWTSSFRKGSLKHINSNQRCINCLHQVLVNTHMELVSTCESPNPGPGRSDRRNGRSTSAWRRAPFRRCTHPQASSHLLDDGQKVWGRKTLRFMKKRYNLKRK